MAKSITGRNDSTGPVRLIGKIARIELPAGAPAPLWRLVAAGDNATDLEDAWICNFDAYLCGADRRIQHRTDIADVAGQRPVGIGIELDLCRLPERQLGNVILIDIADDPYAGEIGDGEGSRRP